MAGKLLTFPLAIMFAIALISTLMGSTISDASWSATNNGTTLSGLSFSFGAVSMIAVLGGIVLLATFAGTTIFGIGMKETSILLIFKSLGFLGIYALLSVLSSAAFAGAGQIGVTSWIGLTGMYMVGFFLHVRGGTDG
jgi:hypothetical protein